MAAAIVIYLGLTFAAALTRLLYLWCGGWTSRELTPEDRCRAARWTLALPLWMPFIAAVYTYCGIYYGLRWLVRTAMWKAPPEMPDVDEKRGPYR